MDWQGKYSIMFRLATGLGVFVRYFTGPVVGVYRFDFQVDVYREWREVFVYCLHGVLVCVATCARYEQVFVFVFQIDLLRILGFACLLIGLLIKCFKDVRRMMVVIVPVGFNAWSFCFLFCVRGS